MKAMQILNGHVYELQAGRNKTTVKVITFQPRTNSWECETGSGKTMNVKNAARFLREIPKEKPVSELPTKKNTTPKPAVQRKKGGKPKGQMSAIESAYAVLSEAGRPMNAREITETAIRESLWSPEGATPHMTLSAAVQRDIIKRKENSRFVKAGKGLFTARQ